MAAFMDELAAEIQKRHFHTAVPIFTCYKLVALYQRPSTYSHSLHHQRHILTTKSHSYLAKERMIYSCGTMIDTWSRKGGNESMR